MKKRNVKKIVAVLIIIALVLIGLKNYFLPAPDAPLVLKGKTYSIEYSLVGELIDSPDTRDTIGRHLPELANLRQLKVARPLTLREMQPFYSDMLNEPVLQALEADLLMIKGTSVEIYTTGSTVVGTILDDPEARAIVDRYLPGFSTNPQIDQGRGFTLNFMQNFDRETITDEVLANINTEFEILATNRAGGH